MHQAALVIAGEKEGPTPEEWGKAFAQQIQMTQDKDRDEKAQIRAGKEASVVAALIVDPSLNAGGLEKSLTGKWLEIAQKNKAVTKEAREGEAFGLLAEVKVADQPAALFLRNALNEAKEYNGEALKQGLDRLLPELAKENAPPVVQSAEADVPKEEEAPPEEEDERIA
jgi:hypothetical protein